MYALQYFNTAVVYYLNSLGCSLTVISICFEFTKKIVT